jgi:hypothetical protein
MKLFILSFPHHAKLSKLCAKFAINNVLGVTEIVYLWDDFHLTGQQHPYGTGANVINYSYFKHTNLATSGWIRQQFVKLQLHLLTTDEDFYILDGDTLVRNPIDLRPNRMLTFTEHHYPYFEFIDKALRLQKKNDFSFISPLVRFEREVLVELENYSNAINGCDLFETFLQCNYDPSTLPISECEIYGTFATQILGKTFEFISSPFTECSLAKPNGNDFEELYFTTNCDLVLSGSEYFLSDYFWDNC